MSMELMVKAMKIRVGNRKGSTNRFRLYPSRTETNAGC